MLIINSTQADIDAIFELYDVATAHQKAVAEKHWLGFERTMVETEIREQRQYKIMENDQIACVFAVTFSDLAIWQDRNADPSIYIHRIATNPKFRGNHFVKIIVAWAKDFAVKNALSYIRMDTGSGNDKLNNYYVSCGFEYLGITKLGDAKDLPEHYKKGDSSLFEIKI